jgi:hypothetical protein
VLGESLTDGEEDGLDDGRREVDGVCEGRVDGGVVVCERVGSWDGLVEGSALLDGT